MVSFSVIIIGVVILVAVAAVIGVVALMASGDKRDRE